ncbi:MAG: sulfite exporter TauE/SafE family protein [Candidatus Kerfeldbacteria bacterium]|nr:sulfite exporter TauE/SafE family protein [Candidatus Kerfeldbacteria bacterium]
MPSELSQPSLLLAFAGGLVAFLSPCFFPLIPAYLGYFGGTSIREQAAKQPGWRIRTVSHSLLFIAGFLIVFTALGAGAGSISRNLLVHRQIFLQLGGVLFILFGLFLLGAFQRFVLLSGEAKFHLSAHRTKYQGLNAFLLGLTFAFAWTPCIGPVLGTILTLAAASSTAGTGSLLLFVFGLGIAFPFLIISFFLDRLFAWLRRFSQVTIYAQRVAGALLMTIGVFMVVGKYGQLTTWILSVTKFQPAL